MGKSWHCPHCNRSVTITDSDVSELRHRAPTSTKIGDILVRTHWVVCPNAECKEATLKAYLWNYEDTYSGTVLKGKALSFWTLRPDSEAKVMPPYVPVVIAEDYYEACKIKDLSPKASATLARRCLQGMIRDFHGISKSRLKDEIDALEGTIDPLTWESIDAIRKVGNIGAHMEKDINTIIDVEPEEAALLLELIESLVEDWYTTRYNREENKRKLIELAKAKEAQKAVKA